MREHATQRLELEWVEPLEQGRQVALQRRPHVLRCLGGVLKERRRFADTHAPIICVNQDDDVAFGLHCATPDHKWVPEAHRDGNRLQTSDAHLATILSSRTSASL